MTLSRRAIRFALLRPWFFLRGLMARRDRPDLDRLRAIEDPERFVWAILPHAARTFAPSIVGLPYRRAIVAAVGYLYARMLDTYEDLERSSDAKMAGLAGFAGRFRAPTPTPAPPLADARLGDDRDLLHVLLLERCHVVDRVFTGLDSADRLRIVSMIEAMAADMQEFVRRFADQGGRLADDGQIEQYCHAVIGHPIVFTLRTLLGEQAAVRAHEDAMDLSVLIQLANITRDIEKDLARGIAYHPGLDPSRPAADDEVAAARRYLVGLALGYLPTYRRLVDDLRLSPISLARGSAVLMALHTDRHYRAMAGRCGMVGWSGRDATVAIWASALAGIVSSRWTARVLRRIEEAAPDHATTRYAGAHG